MSGIIRYRENEDTGEHEMYDARCTNCIDFTPSYAFQYENDRWSMGDRASTKEDEHIACCYCKNSVNSAYLETESEEDYSYDSDASPVQYAEGFTFVNVYEVDRVYGGPEEGGWYYDTGRLVLSRQVPAAEANSIAESLRVKYPNNGKYYSVIYSGGDYRVYVESTPGADFPGYTPHYECVRES